MWIRLRKELSALALSWSHLLGLALIVVLLGLLNGILTLAAAYWLLCFAVASRLFGAEFDHGTLPRLLAQPISRARIWGEKMLAGGAVILAGSGVLWLALWDRWQGVLGAGWELEGSYFLLPVVALATGPTVSLWLRDSLRTFWASMALPVAFLFWVLMLWALAGGGATAPTTGWLLVPYCAVMLTLGYRRFLSLEIAPGNSSAHSRPTAGARPTVSAERRPRGLLRELILKELGLQHTGLLLIPLAMASWIVLWLLSFKADMPMASGDTLGDLLTILGWAPALVLALAVPALLGASAVAAERQLGATGWQLGLPVSCRLQWRVKLAVGVILTLLSGCVGLALSSPLPELRFELGEMPLYILYYGPLPLLAFTAGLFGSRHARGPFQALGLALIFGGVLWYVWGLLQFTSFFGVVLWPFSFAPLLFLGDLGFAGLVDVTMVVLLLALVWTAPRPEKWIAGQRLVRSRGLTALAVLAVLALAAQVLLLTWTGRELEREIAARDAEIEFLGGTSSLDWLARELQLPDRPLAVEELPKIIDLDTHIVLNSPRPHYYNYYAPLRRTETRFMSLTAWVDGTSLRKPYRWYWMRDRYGLLYSTYAGSRSLEGVVTRRDVPTPWRHVSIAPLWLQASRQAQLDRRVRQDVIIEAVRTGRRLERWRTYNPQAFEQAVRFALRPKWIPGRKPESAG